MWLIDPAEIEWRSSKYQRGRRITTIAEFSPRTGTREKITVRATPGKARAAIADLEHRIQCGEISQVPIVESLDEISRKARSRRSYPVETKAIKISATPLGARLLLDDLAFWTRGSLRNRKQVSQSFLWDLLHVAATAHGKRRMYVRQAIGEGVQRYGPWIYSFAKRLTQGRADADDVALLENIVASAQEAGYKRAEFFSLHRAPRLLVWPIQAFLIELCLGGKPQH